MNPQNIIRAAIAVASVVVCGVATKNHLDVIKTERQKRAEIEQDTLREIAAIRRASNHVQRKIANGDYDRAIFNGSVIQQIATDQKFYTMAERFNG